MWKAHKKWAVIPVALALQLIFDILFSYIELPFIVIYLGLIIRLALDTYYYVEKIIAKNAALSKKEKLHWTEVTRINLRKIQEKKRRYGADAAIGLMNLSGLQASSNGACGIYLFRNKILFETQIAHFNLPLDRLKNVYIDKQVNVASDYDSKQCNKVVGGYFIPYKTGFESAKNYSGKIEQNLVFEYITDNNSTGYIVFAYRQRQFDEVQFFMNATLVKRLNMIS